jgi:hypothetical protein
MLRKIFGPKRDEVTWDWRRLHNEGLLDLHSIPNIIQMIKLREMRCAGHVAHVGSRIGAYRVLVGQPEGKRPHGMHGVRWEDNI